MSVTLLEFLQNAAKSEELTKAEFGRIMHDPFATQEEIDKALKIMEEAGGYENLGD